MKRFICVFASIIFGLFLVLSLSATPKQIVVVVHGPTVVAFFMPVTQADLDANPDLNEVLSDFQVYAEQLRKPLQDGGIDFKVIYALSFRVRNGTKTTTFHTKGGVGYYFVAPRKAPHIEHDVQTSEDTLQAASEYFGLDLK